MLQIIKNNSRIHRIHQGHTNKSEMFPKTDQTFKVELKPN